MRQQGGSSLDSTTLRVAARIGTIGTDPVLSVDSSTAVGVGTTVRSAATVDGSAFWVSASNGMTYAPLANTSPTALSSTTGLRVAGIYGGHLYATSIARLSPVQGCGGGRVCLLGTGLPT